MGYATGPRWLRLFFQIPRQSKHQAAETWDAVKDAVVGVAATKLTGFIDDVLPGFRQEFTKAKTGEGSTEALV